MMDKAFRRARRSWRVDQDNKSNFISKNFPYSVSYGLKQTTAETYGNIASEMGIEFVIFNGNINFKTQEDLNAVKICL